MRAVINTLSYFATKRQKNITLIVSTTGDTGPAAVQAGEYLTNEILSSCNPGFLFFFKDDHLTCPIDTIVFN